MVKKVITFIRQRIIAGTTTFFEGKSGTNRDASHSLDHFEYSKEEMIGFGKKFNWAPTYIGNWDHPRDQMMMLYTSK